MPWIWRATNSTLCQTARSCPVLATLGCTHSSPRFGASDLHLFRKSGARRRAPPGHEASLHPSRVLRPVRELLEPSFRCFFKYWPNCPYPVIGARTTGNSTMAEWRAGYGNHISYSDNLLAMLSRVDCSLGDPLGGRPVPLALRVQRADIRGDRESGPAPGRVP